jgi:hypothetical protein
VPTRKRRRRSPAQTARSPKLARLEECEVGLLRVLKNPYSLRVRRYCLCSRRSCAIHTSRWRWLPDGRTSREQSPSSFPPHAKLAFHAPESPSRTTGSTQVMQRICRCRPLRRHHPLQPLLHQLLVRTLRRSFQPFVHFPHAHRVRHARAPRLDL